MLIQSKTNNHDCIIELCIFSANRKGFEFWYNCVYMRSWSSIVCTTTLELNTSIVAVHFGLDGNDWRKVFFFNFLSFIVAAIQNRQSQLKDLTLQLWHQLQRIHVSIYATWPVGWRQWERTDQPKKSYTTLFAWVMSQISLSVNLSGTLRAYLLNMISKFAGMNLK